MPGSRPTAAGGSPRPPEERRHQRLDVRGKLGEPKLTRRPAQLGQGRAQERALLRVSRRELAPLQLRSWTELQQQREQRPGQGRGLVAPPRSVQRQVADPPGPHAPPPPP